MIITVDRLDINVELLNEDILAALPGVALGITTGRGLVNVHLIDSATDTDITTATRVVYDHDEKALSIGQQRQQQQAADIETGRITYADTIIDADHITLSSLARRVMWLENELRQLRGL